MEAKDRLDMALGEVPTVDDLRQGLSRKSKSALAVGARYMYGLGPLVTWVCNHCDFRDKDLDPSANYGDAWSQLHVAAAFRPGQVPPAFFDTLQVALAPPGVRPDERAEVGGFVLVVDVTGSMRSRLGDVWSAFWNEPPGGERWSEYRGVLYRDHGDNEPFVTRSLRAVRHASRARRRHVSRADWAWPRRQGGP